MIKAEEIMINNKNIVGFSIDHILDLVDVEIESINIIKLSKNIIIRQANFIKILIIKNLN